jgi:hypothetical protein
VQVEDVARPRAAGVLEQPERRDLVLADVRGRVADAEPFELADHLADEVPVLGLPENRQFH